MGGREVQGLFEKLMKAMELLSGRKVCKYKQAYEFRGSSTSLPKILGKKEEAPRSQVIRKGNAVTLNCLFSSRSLWTSPCSLLHSSITFLTSVSSKEELRDLDTVDVSVFDAVVDIILFISTSCCSEINESPSVTNYVIKDFFMQSKVALSNTIRGSLSSTLQDVTFI